MTDIELGNILLLKYNQIIMCDQPDLPDVADFTCGQTPDFWKNKILQGTLTENMFAPLSDV